MSSRKAKLRALDDIDLEIGENEFVTLVGRSGCGKSTLLRLMAGLIRPTAGQVARIRTSWSFGFGCGGAG